MRIAGSSVAMMPPSVIPSALNAMPSSTMPALAAMTPPTSMRKAPAPTTMPAKIFLMGAGIAWKARSRKLSVSTTARTMGLKTGGERLAEHHREGLKRPAQQRLLPLEGVEELLAEARRRPLGAGHLVAQRLDGLRAPKRHLRAVAHGGERSRS
jgi:hypothetical protein